MSTVEHDIGFAAMGCDVRILVAGRGAADALPEARRLVEDFDARLSRFRPTSELCALNVDPSATVPTSTLLRAALRGGLWAAQRTNGLVTPVVVDALEAAGYRQSLAGATPAPLSAALAAAPPRRAAGPDPAQPWRRVAVDDTARVVRRPPGLRLDTGGTGKGLTADVVARNLRWLDRAVVDCGGDVRVTGRHARTWPLEVEVVHPLSGEVCRVLTLRGGAVATSGIDVRLWRRDDGTFAHHLLDPSTGQPAWTGLIGVTALAPTALEAETLSKVALLSGPRAARRVLREHGGLLVRDDGEVELAGPLLRERMVVRIPGAV